jgi:hypothetical protein
MPQRLRELFTSVWFIALAALALRLAFLFHQASLIPSEILASVPFQNEVGNVSAAIARGDGFCCLFRQPTGPTAWLAPIFPLLVAGIFKLFGTFTLAAFYAATVLNCIFSSLAAIPLFYAGKRIAGLTTAATAAWLWAIFPSGIVMPFEWVWDTSLSALLAAALLWATLALVESYRPRNAAAYGVLWAISLLTNPVLGSLFPFLVGWILYRRYRSGSLRPAPILLTFAVLIAACLPWTIRNFVQFHRFLPIRSNFSFELWSGNNEIFDEHSRMRNRITRYEEAHRYAQLGEMAFIDDSGQEARHFIRVHPALFLRLCGRRIVATWLGTETPGRDFARTDSLLVRFLFLWNAATLIGVIFGLARLYWTSNYFLFPVAVFPLVFPLIFYIAHTSLRYRHPCDPILALLFGVALTLPTSKPAQESHVK